MPPSALPAAPPSRPRRRLVLAALVAAAVAAGAMTAWRVVGRGPVETAGGLAITSVEREILEAVERRGIDFFWLEANPENGLIKDRAHYRERTPLEYAPCSIASIGFGLSALVVAADRGWLPREEVYNRVLTTLRTLSKAQRVHGFFYHLLDMKSGLRTWKSEISSVDTALLLAGVLHAGAYFRGTEVDRLSRDLYEAVEWPWMTDGGRTLTMGWTPEQGFLPHRWDQYCESMLMYLLAIGSPTHPLPASAWHEIARPIGKYGDNVCIASPPLFTHQYAHVWIDFRDKHDSYADYFENSRQATRANRQFCIDHKDDFSTYAENVWGLTACQAPDGYRAYGAPPGRAIHDGTVAPTAAIGSIVFTPRDSIDLIRHLFERRQDLWGSYGFCDAFNDAKRWYSREVLGIDKGAEVLMIENFLRGSVWAVFSTIPDVQRAMKLVGFRDGRKTFDYSRLIYDYFQSPLDRRPAAVVPRAARAVAIDGDPAEWGAAARIELDPSYHLEDGSIQLPDDARADVRLAYDDLHLYVVAVVRDDELVTHRPPDKIYLDDCLELYVDPKGDNLQWGDPRDFQIGLTPSGPEGTPRSWCWFQQKSGEGIIRIAAKVRADDYVLEAAIPWAFLGGRPAPGRRIGFTAALHDQDVSNFAKLTWFFHEPGIVLGEISLGGGP